VNDLSAFDGDAERERQICDLRVKGKTEREVCAMLGCTVADIHRALDRAAQASMTPAARVRGIYIDAARLERIQQVFIPLVESVDDKAAMVIIRAQERKATLMGDKAPLRVDPIQLAHEAQPKLTSTGELMDALNRLRASDPKRRMNGGPGYSTEFHHDERDDEDAELIKMRERNDYVGGDDD
jgi:hypothetical protein